MEIKHKKQFMSYAKIVMLISISIEFILNLVFISISSDIKSEKIEYHNSKKDKDINIYSDHYSGISAAFSLFVISFSLFILAFIINCKFEDLIDKVYQNVIILTTFIICQLLYFIECMIIPVYLTRASKLTLLFENNEKIVQQYKDLTALCIIFLVIIMILDIVVLNLFREMCCQMETICEHAEDCAQNFGRCFVDKLTCLCGKEEKDINVRNAEQKNYDLDVTINNLTGDISNLMAQNIELTLEKSNI